MCQTKEILEIIEQLIQELKSSGYNRKQAKEIVCSGLKGWQSKYRKRKRNNQNFYRLAKETAQERMKKELMEKENWFKNNRDEESPAKSRKMNTGHLVSTKTQKKLYKNGHQVDLKEKGKEKDMEITSVLFVPHTNDSILAKKIREKEEKIKDITGNRIKVVERAGVKLQDILVKDPWKGKDCGRQNCFVCTTKMLTEKGERKDCTKRNVVYEIQCLTCKDREIKRIEEEYGNEESIKERKGNQEICIYWRNEQIRL